MRQNCFESIKMIFICIFSFHISFYGWKCWQVNFFVGGENMASETVNEAGAVEVKTINQQHIRKMKFFPVC